MELIQYIIVTILSFFISLFHIPIQIEEIATTYTNQNIRKTTNSVVNETTKSPTLQPKPTVARYIPKKTSDDNEPWGVAKKIGDHTYTIKLGSDERMGSPKEIYEALNVYRNQNGSGYLEWNDVLAQYASQRAQLFKEIQKTDAHAGLNHYLNNEDGFNKLGFNHIGENSYFGESLLGVHIIEWLFAASKEHNANQLDKSWSHVGIGVTDTSVNVIFGGGKM